MSSSRHEEGRGAAIFGAAALAGVLSFGAAVQPAVAVSGGGLDYASSDIKAKDFSKGDYSKKDFSGCIASLAKFQDAKVGGARFFKADLKGADFTGASAAGTSFESADLEGTVFKNAVLTSAYFTSSTIDQAESIEGADFSDAIFSPKMEKKLCALPSAKGTNPVTGVETRDSLFCP